MRIDFNVIWVEDQPNNVGPQLVAIRSRMQKEGFRLREKFVGSHSAAMELLDDTLYGDHVDLVLMDEELDSGESGADGIRALRRRFPYKDVVFYSANSQLVLGAKVAERELQGVYWTPRDSIVDTVTEVFETLVKKVVDLDHSRGIVLGATSTIDAIVDEFLAAWLAVASDASKIGLDSYTRKLAQTKKKDFEKRVSQIGPTTGTTEILGIKRFLESQDKLRLCQTMIKVHNGDKENLSPLSRYIDFVPNRNVLAHVSASPGPGFSQSLKRTDGSEITVDEMTRLRKELLDYLEFFEQLNVFLPPH